MPGMKIVCISFFSWLCFGAVQRHKIDRSTVKGTVLIGILVVEVGHNNGASGNQSGDFGTNVRKTEYGKSPSTAYVYSGRLGTAAGGDCLQLFGTGLECGCDRPQQLSQ